jgi:hypothetical protein
VDLLPVSAAIKHTLVCGDVSGSLKRQRRLSRSWDICRGRRSLAVVEAGRTISTSFVEVKSVGFLVGLMKVQGPVGTVKSLLLSNQILSLLEFFKTFAELLVKKNVKFDVDTRYRLDIRLKGSGPTPWPGPKQEIVKLQKRADAANVLLAADGQNRYAKASYFLQILIRKSAGSRLDYR